MTAQHNTDAVMALSLSRSLTRVISKLHVLFAQPSMSLRTPRDPKVKSPGKTTLVCARARKEGHGVSIAWCSTERRGGGRGRQVKSGVESLPHDQRDVEEAGCERREHRGVSAKDEEEHRHDG